MKNIVVFCLGLLAVLYFESGLRPHFPLMA